MGKTSHRTKVPKTCFTFILQYNALIQKIFVRIEDNVYPDDDPSGRVSALPFIHIFLSLICVCVFVISGLLETITVKQFQALG